MQKVVHKYALSQAYYGGTQNVSIPKGSEILHLDLQFGYPTLWVLQPLNESRMDTIAITAVLTGMPTSANFTKEDFIGTLLMDGGNFVVHFFLDRALSHFHG